MKADVRSERNKRCVKCGVEEERCSQDRTNGVLLAFGDLICFAVEFAVSANLHKFNIVLMSLIKLTCFQHQTQLGMC